MTTEVAYIFPLANTFWRGHAKKFAESIRQHPAGVLHKLIVVGKSDKLTEIPDEDAEVFAGTPCEFVVHNNEGYDIGGFIRRANETDAPILCCMGGATIVTADNWLQLLTQPFRDDPRCGITGAFGSWEAVPHIRTTAFCFQPEVFRQMHFPPILDGRVDRGPFEHGPDSITQQAVRLKGEAYVCAKDGKIYGIKDWNKMPNRFRFGDQSNMVAWDNYCGHYAAGNAVERFSAERCAGWI